MEVITFLFLSGALFTAIILLHLSASTCASKLSAWTLPFTLYGFGIIPNIAVGWLKRFNYVGVGAPLRQPSSRDDRSSMIETIKALAEHHEVAEILSEMIRKDGAGSWPPNANHAHSTWPAPLRPYKEICLELAPLLPQATPSLDDAVNTARIEEFRQQFRESLRERVDLVEVKNVSRAKRMM